MRSSRSEGFLTSFHHRPWVRALALLCAVWLVACTSYTPVELKPEPLDGFVRITTTDGGQILLRDPWVEDGFIYGDIWTCADGRFRKQAHSIRMGAVASVEKQEGLRQLVDCPEEDYSPDEDVGLELGGIQSRKGKIIWGLVSLATAGVFLYCIPWRMWRYSDPCGDWSGDEGSKMGFGIRIPISR